MPFAIWLKKNLASFSENRFFCSQHPLFLFLPPPLLFLMLLLHLPLLPFASIVPVGNTALSCPKCGSTTLPGTFRALLNPDTLHLCPTCRIRHVKRTWRCPCDRSWVSCPDHAMLDIGCIFLLHAELLQNHHVRHLVLLSTSMLHLLKMLR